MKEKKIEIHVGGGPDATSENKEFWATIWFYDGKLEEFSTKQKKEQLDTYFSKNKKLALEKAVAEAEYLCSLHGVEQYDIIDTVAQKEDLNSTVSVVSNHKGKIS